MSTSATPGITHKEDFGSGSSAAALGGVTTVMVMPTDVPPTLTADELSEKRAAIEGRSHVDFMLQAAVGPDASTVPALAEAGAVSFEFFLADMADRMRLDDDARLLEAFEAVRGTGLVAGVSPGSHALHALFLARAKEAHGPARSGWLASGRRRRGARRRPPSCAVTRRRRPISTDEHSCGGSRSSQPTAGRTSPPRRRRKPPLRRRRPSRLGRSRRCCRDCAITPTSQSDRGGARGRHRRYGRTDHAPHARGEAKGRERTSGRRPAAFPACRRCCR